MSLAEILSVVSEVAKNQDTSVFIVGGIPRDKLLNKLNNIEDIDLTTGDTKIHYIAKEVSIKFGPKASYKILNDGHAQIIVDQIKLDFSSNFNIPNIKNILIKAGIKKPTDMEAELYSRDFTCNALLMSTSLKEIMDPTGLGIQDIKSKILRTCLPAAITLGYDNKRVARIIYLACKLDFDIDDNITDWVKKHPESISSNSSQQYVTKKILKAVKYNKSKTVKLLDQMGLWKFIPPIKELAENMIKNPERI